MNTKDLAALIVGLVLLAAVILGPVACTMRRHQLIADAIKNGVDPISARCAIEESTGYEPVCVVSALPKK